MKLSESYNGADHWIYLGNLSEGKIRNKRTGKLEWINREHDFHYMSLLKTKYRFSDGSEKTYLSFIEDKRIELNTIIDEIGAQRFWFWLRDKLIQIFPTRDYNHAIRVPDFVLTDTMQEFKDKLEKELTKILAPNTNNIESAYEQTTGGFITTDKSKTYTNQYLKNILEQKDSIKEIDSDLQAILKKLE